MNHPIQNRKIALIGGAGFIGHNLALHLKSAGADVQVVDSLQVNNLLYFQSSNNDIPNKDLYLRIVNERLDLLRNAGIPIHIQDARQYDLLSRVLSDIKPHVIIQLAAVAHANRSNKDPFSTFDHSLRTLENALDYSRGNIEHFLFFSSSMVYGNFLDGSVSEETKCNPLGIYGALKFAGEKMVIAYNQVFDLPYTIIRPSALYGERCVSRRVGQIFIENAIKGLEITINGDGSDSLDFTYIDDLCQGVMKSIQQEKARNEIFNLTYGKAHSLAQMADIVHSHFPDINVKYIPKDNLTPDRGTLSVEKARELIGYEPQYDLAKGYLRYIQWYKDMFTGAKTD